MQTIKRAIRKWTDTHQVDCHWDDALPYILLGYRCSVQAATGLCPYEILLHGCKPTVPPAIMERMTDEIDFDDAEKAAAQLIARKQLLEEHCLIAGHNIAIAQHMDTLRYSHTRSGTYAPKLFNITDGSFVYIRRVIPNTAHMAARPGIYRVVELRANGVLLLDGRCATTFKIHLNNVAPCHLPNIDPTQDSRLARPHADYPCYVCKSEEKDSAMMLCDSCNKAFHLRCLQPPLDEPPTDDVWICSICIKGGINPDDIRALPDPEHRIPAKIYTSKDPKGAKHAATYAGRYVETKQTQPDGKKIPYYGKISFRGAAYKPNYFTVTYQDGVKINYNEKQIKPILMSHRKTLPQGIVLSIRKNIYPHEETPEFPDANQALMHGGSTHPHDTRVLKAAIDFSYCKINNNANTTMAGQDALIMHPGPLWVQHALQLAVTHTGRVACVLLPANDLTTDEAKQNTIYTAAKDGRVTFLPSPASHNVWIIIFLDANTRTQMINIKPRRLEITTWLPNNNSILHDAGDQDRD